MSTPASRIMDLIRQHREGSPDLGGVQTSGPIEEVRPGYLSAQDAGIGGMALAPEQPQISPEFEERKNRIMDILRQNRGQVQEVEVPGGMQQPGVDDEPLLEDQWDATKASLTASPYERQREYLGSMGVNIPSPSPGQDLNKSWISEYGKAAREDFYTSLEVAKTAFMSDEEKKKSDLPFFLKDPVMALGLGGLGMAFSWLSPAIRIEANARKAGTVLVTEAGKMDMPFHGTAPSEMYPELDEQEKEQYGERMNLEGPLERDALDPSRYAAVGRHYYAGEEQESVFDKEWSVPSIASLVSAWDSPRFQREFDRIGRFEPGEGPSTGSVMADTILDFTPGLADLGAGKLLNIMKRASQMNKLQRKKFLTKEIGSDNSAFFMDVPEDIWKIEDAQNTGGILATKFEEPSARGILAAEFGPLGTRTVQDVLPNLRGLAGGRQGGLMEKLRAQDKMGGRISDLELPESKLSDFESQLAELRSGAKGVEELTGVAEPPPNIKAIINKTVNRTPSEESFVNNWIHETRDRLSRLTPEEQIRVDVRRASIEAQTKSGILSVNFGPNKYQRGRSFEYDFGKDLELSNEINRRTKGGPADLLAGEQVGVPPLDFLPIEEATWNAGGRLKALRMNKARKEIEEEIASGLKEEESIRQNTTEVTKILTTRKSQINRADKVQDENAKINQSVPREVTPEDMDKLYKKADGVFGGRNVFWGNRNGTALNPDGTPMVSETTGINPKQVEIPGRPGEWEMQSENVRMVEHPSVVQSMGMGPDGPYTYQQYKALEEAIDTIKKTQDDTTVWFKHSVEKKYTGEGRGFQNKIVDPAQGWGSPIHHSLRVVDRNVISQGMIKMAQISPDSKEIATSLMKIRRQYMLRTGIIQDDLNKLFNGMSESERFQVQNVMETGTSSGRKKIDNAAIELRSLYDSLAAEASYLGLRVWDMKMGYRPFRRKKDYIPTRIKPKYLKGKGAKELKKYQEKTFAKENPELSPEEVQAYIAENFNNTEKLGHKVSHLNFSNKGAIPEHMKIKDPHIIAKEYADDVIRKLEAIHEFGIDKNGSHPKLRNLLARIARDNPDDINYVSRMAKAELGIDMHRAFTYKWANLLKMIATFRFLTPHSGVLNTTQTIAGAPLSGSVEAYAKALKTVAGDKKGSASLAMRAGAVTDRALNDVMEKLFGTMSWATWWSKKVTKIPQTEYWNRVLAYHTGREYLEELTMELMEISSRINKGGKLARKKAQQEMTIVRRRIEELTVNPDDIISNNGILKERQLMDAGYEFNIQVNFSADPMRNPLVASHPFAGIFYQFRNFPAHRARQLNRELGDYIRRTVNSKTRNPAEFRKMIGQFTKFGSTTAAAGAIIWTDDYLIQLGSYLDSGVMEGRWNWNKDQESVAQHFTELSMASSMGMYYNLIAAARYGDPWNLIGGAPGSLVRETKDLYKEVTEGDFREAMRAIRGNIPGYQRYVRPYDPQTATKARLPKGPKTGPLPKRLREYSR